jgi:hypothetical protein
MTRAAAVIRPMVQGQRLTLRREHTQIVVGPGGEQRQDLVVAQGGGVVFSAGPHG